MTVPNPFIEFFKDPVFVLGWTAYALVLATILAMGVRSVLRGIPTQYNRWKNNRHNSKKWWSIGDMSYGIIPPLDWMLKLAWHIGTLAASLLIAGALLWLLGV